MIVRLFAMLLGIAVGPADSVALQRGDLPAQRSPVYGGAGGAEFALACGPGHVLTGLRSRARTFVDAVGLTCRPVLANGTLGPETTVGPVVGGTSGQPNVASCKPGHVVAKAEVRAATYVDLIVITCRAWDATARQVKPGDSEQLSYGNPASQAGRFVSQCDFAAQPMVGLRGRAANLVDAVGFVCDEP